MLVLERWILYEVSSSRVDCNFNDTSFEEFDLILTDTLYLFFPGEYILGALLFLVSLAVLHRDIEYIKQQQDKKDQSTGPSPSQLPSNYGSASTLATDD